MAATKTGPAAPFTEEQITDALMACVAWAGNANAAERSLKAQGRRTPSYTTLLNWMRDIHSERYHELRERYAEQLEQQLAHEYRDVASLATQGARKAVERAVENLEKGVDKDPSRTAANLATVADKYTRDMLTLQGKPTSIREDRNMNEILRSLAERGVIELPEEPKQIGDVSEPAGA